MRGRVGGVGGGVNHDCALNDGGLVVAVCVWWWESEMLVWHVCVNRAHVHGEMGMFAGDETAGVLYS